MSEQAANQTSSIGAVWPPAPSSNNRIKGFYDRLVATPEDADEFLNIFADYKSQAQEHPEVGRLSIRALTGTDIIPLLDSAGVTLEGALPVRGTDEAAIVYVGWNAPERTASEDRIIGHRRLLYETIVSPVEVSTEHHLDNIEPRIIDRYTDDAAKDAMVERFADLYDSFGYDKDDAHDLLHNPVNTIAYIEDEEGIVSTAMAERADVPIEGYGMVKITEITEAITRPSSRGKGYYRAISGHLVGELLDSSREQPDVLYGESNLAVRGVLIAAHQNGRRFSYFDRT